MYKQPLSLCLAERVIPLSCHLQVIDSDSNLRNRASTLNGHSETNNNGWLVSHYLSQGSPCQGHLAHSLPSLSTW